MADKTIGELPAASKLYDDSLLVVEQHGQAYNIAGSLIRRFADDAAKSHADHAETSADAAQASAAAAAGSARDAADVALHPPILKDGNDHWWIWDAELNDYADSGVDAGVSLEVMEEVIVGGPGSGASVKNLGTKTDPKLQFTIEKGDPGVSPTVAVSKKGGVTTVTVTDAAGEHTAEIKDGDVSQDTLDAALAEKADRSDTDPFVRWHCNPNLLINWYFAGGGSSAENERFPINQRQWLTYNAPSSVQYCIDRWRIGLGTLTINDDCISIRRADGVSYGGISSKYYLPEFDDSQPVTISVLTKDNLYTGTVIPGQDNAVQIAGPDYFRFIKTEGEEGVYEFDINLLSDKIYNLVAVKAERGPVQTLAHKEGDKWVLNEIPDYGTEWMKCRRYFRRYTTLPLQLLLSFIPYPDCTFIPLDVEEMRAKPNVTLFAAQIIGHQNTLAIGVDIGAVINVLANGINVGITQETYSKVTVGNGIYFHGLELDAEL